MTFSATGGANSNGSSATTGSITHGLTINSGDLVVAYVHTNATNSISNDAGGAAWTEAANETPTSETARQACFWKVAGASEPSSYSWTLNATTNYQIILYVFTSASDAEVDSAAATHRQSSNSQNMVCGAANGAVISDDAVSVIFGGKDSRAGTDSWATVDNSYTGVEGVTTNQDTCGAYRIYTTGTTFSGDITFTDPGASASDKTYSVHISFVEGGGGGGSVIPIIMQHHNHFKGGIF